MNDSGDWGPLVRLLSDGDPQRAAMVQQWLVADALFALEQILKREALHTFELETLIWAVMAQAAGKKAGRAPRLPAILNG